MNKRAISEMVSYVMLVVITIGVSVLVYAFLSTFILRKPPVECPEGAALIVQNYNCNTVNNILNLTMKNSGTYTINGFLFKVSNTTRSPSMALFQPDDPSSTDPTYVYPRDVMKPGDIQSFRFDYSVNQQVTEMFIEPIYSTSTALCANSIIIQKVNDCN